MNRSMRKSLIITNQRMTARLRLIWFPCVLHSIGFSFSPAILLTIWCEPFQNIFGCFILIG
ncbi:hypothetical protein D3849_10120 [Streptococcus mutans]|nr:hypothetical protein [Streptococcus mutans]